MNMKDQITLTKSNRMSDTEKKCFDLLKDWGYHRFSLICTLLQLAFTENEMDNPNFCKTKLLGLIEKQTGGTKAVKTIPATSVPEPVKTVEQTPHRSTLSEYKSNPQEELRKPEQSPRDFLKGFNQQNGINDSH